MWVYESLGTIYSIAETHRVEFKDTNFCCVENICNKNR